MTKLIDENGLKLKENQGMTATDEPIQIVECEAIRLSGPTDDLELAIAKLWGDDDDEDGD